MIEMMDTDVVNADVIKIIENVFIGNFLKMKI